MLTGTELEIFVRDGFFVKKSLLSRKDRDRCLGITWGILAEQGITEDPATWSKAYDRRGVIKLRDEIAENETLHEAITSCGGVHETIADLMGPDFVNCGVRGVYPTLPIPRHISRPYEAHIENHPCQVVVMYYLDDVTTHNGGLMVWPGSHRDVYTSHEKRFDFSARAKFLNVFRQHNVKAPFELTGSAGDVLFFHHRLFHSGSNNFGDTIRFGILNDFIPSNFDEIRGGTPTAENMWDYWSPAVQKIAADLADVSPLTRPGSQPVRAFLLRAFRAFRRLKGSYADEYEEKYARAKARSDDG